MMACYLNSIIKAGVRRSHHSSSLARTSEIVLSLLVVVIVAVGATNTGSQMCIQ